MLVIEAISGMTGASLLYSIDSLDVAYGLQAVAFSLFVPLLASYLRFLATLPTPLTRPLRSRGVGLVLAATSVAYVLYLLANTERFIAGFEPTSYARLEAVSGDLIAASAPPAIAIYVYGMVAALDTWRRAPRGSAARKQGAIIALAFLIRDLTFVLLVASVAALEIRMSLVYWLFPTLMTAFYLVLAYGVLSQQLFGIDLKLKWTIRGGTVAAAFVAVFLIASQLVENLASDTLGVVAGSIAAGLLLFALAPLQQLAGKLSDAAMPRVKDDDEYRTVRRRDLYRAAVEGALLDGGVSDRERAMLARVAAELGLGPIEMHDIEREARSALGRAA